MHVQCAALYFAANTKRVFLIDATDKKYAGHTLPIRRNTFSLYLSFSIDKELLEFTHFIQPYYVSSNILGLLASF